MNFINFIIKQIQELMWRKSFSCFDNGTVTKGFEENINIIKRQPVILNSRNLEQEKLYIRKPIFDTKRPSSVGAKVYFTYSSPASVEKIQIKNVPKKVTFQQPAKRSSSTPKPSTPHPLGHSPMVKFTYQNKKIGEEPLNQKHIVIEASPQTNRYQRIVQLIPTKPVTMIRSKCPFCHNLIVLVPQKQIESQYATEKWDQKIITVFKCECLCCHKKVSMVPEPGHNYIPNQNRVQETPRLRHHRKQIQKVSQFNLQTEKCGQLQGKKLQQVIENPGNSLKQQTAITKASNSGLKKEQISTKQIKVEKFTIGQTQSQSCKTMKREESEILQKANKNQESNTNLSNNDTQTKVSQPASIQLEKIDLNQQPQKAQVQNDGAFSQSKSKSESESEAEAEAEEEDDQGGKLGVRIESESYGYQSEVDKLAQQQLGNDDEEPVNN